MNKSLRILITLLILIGLLSLLVRFILYIYFQFPAPAGDSVLFASVSISKCSHGLFKTGLFDIDPSGNSRYIWHGIVQPAVISFLNFRCDNVGNFLAISIIIAVTLIAIIMAARNAKNMTLGTLILLVASALQFKQGFRPEVMGIFLVVMAEYSISSSAYYLLVVAISLLAWTHPSAFILYTTFLLLSFDKKNWLDLRRSALKLLGIGILANALFLMFYPFPVLDLINGLLAQGRFFASRNDGEFSVYYIRSDFFPLFGISFFFAFMLACWKRPRLIIMLPLIWFYAIRVPTTYYNILPLFVAILSRFAFVDSRKIPKGARLVVSNFVILFATATAVIGLVQGDARDLYSIWKYHSTPDSADSAVRKLRAEGVAFCEGPGFFWMLYPTKNFGGAPRDQAVTTEDCAQADQSRLVNLIPHSGRALISTHCAFSQGTPRTGMLDAIFQTDSGYSFYICPSNISQ